MFPRDSTYVNVLRLVLYLGFSFGGFFGGFFFFVWLFILPTFSCVTSQNVCWLL